MDERELRLDGNAMAGLLQEVLVPEVTMLRGSCSQCGAVAELGAAHLYMYPRAPGAVLRCRICSNTLAVMVSTLGRSRFSLAGLTWLEFAHG